MGRPESTTSLSPVTAHVAGASFTLHGAGVSGGIAIGYAHLISSARLEVAHYEVPADEIDAEVMRLDHAIEEVRGELMGLHAAVPSDAPAEMAAFLDLHLMILNDSMLSAAPRELIRKRRWNAEWALVHQMELLVQRFEEIEDTYLRDRKMDVQQVVERVLKGMLGTGNAPAPPHEENIIVVAHDFSPADMILFKQHQFAGFVTDVGGVTSHTAIVARSLNLPAIVGLHRARQMIRESELLIADGSAGVLIVNPDRQVLAEYQLRQSQFVLERHKLKRLKSTPAATLEGVQVELEANIELPADVEQALEAGATGVGLFRTEFLFLNRNNLPEEEEQFEAYRQVVQAMNGLPVTIRTIDLGADKSLLYSDHLSGPNPALGLRAIRLCLAEPQLFLTQLRAALRASRYGSVRLLVPMIAYPHEIDQVLHYVALAKGMLTQAGIPFDENVPVGAMIEIPAAALALGAFVKKLDFLSIGTNDLIQYTLAIDRTDDNVAHLYDPLHPAVLHLVFQTIRTAVKAGIPVAVCGEMAGEVQLTRLLLGMGLRQFSMHPAQLLAVKQRVLRTSLSEVEMLVQRILRSEDPERTRQLLEKLND